MGYIEGETLAKKKAGGGLGLREGVEVIRQVAETIAYVHCQGCRAPELDAQEYPA